MEIIIIIKQDIKIRLLGVILSVEVEKRRTRKKLEKRRYGRIAVGAKSEKSSGDSSGHRFKVRVGFEYYNRVYDDFYVGWEL